MSYIQFESAREKDKYRQELREEREKLLDKAQKYAQQRAERELKAELAGEKDWMLPSVSKQLDKLHKSHSVSKKSKKKKSKDSGKKKKHTKSSKKKKRVSSDSSESDSDSDEEDAKPKKKKKRRYSSSSSSSTASSSEEEDSDSSDTSHDDDDDDSPKTKKRQKKAKKSKKSKKSSSKRDDTDVKTKKAHKTGDSESAAEWVEKPPVLQRDNWMTESSALMLKTFQKERVEKKPNEKQQIDSYDPAKSVRELNPYWKLTGTGLPTFQKPNDSDEEDKRPQRSHAAGRPASKNWQKNSGSSEGRSSAGQEPRRTSPSPRRSRRRSPSRSRSRSPASASSSSAEESAAATPQMVVAPASAFLTDQQMNELAAKILKAEIMGNTERVNELKEQLERAREVRGSLKERQQQQAAGGPGASGKPKREDRPEHVLLTHTDEKGNTRPLAKARSTFADPRDLYGGRKGGRQKTKKVETHENGQRVRYFADDDRFDIKQMFERERYTNAADSNLEYAKMAGQHKNPNDDLEDIFADTARKAIDDDKADRRSTQRAINEHERLSSQLENCDHCFDSAKMDKRRIVSMGEKFYLCLPWQQGLVAGHCQLVPTHHVTCCTQLDEDAWEELSNFRKAVTRMFRDKRQDVIFYEIANKLQRRPHLTVHCIPVPQRDGENAPFYFKKAIEESEQEWSVNKQLVSLKDKNLRSAIPKGLPYLWVNFGMDRGFAHVIEDENRFPANFAQEIIGGMLELDPQKWRKPHKESNIVAKVKMFADMWRKYEIV